MSENELPRGMILDIFKGPVDCSNGGVSSYATGVTVTHVLDMRQRPAVGTELPQECRVFVPNANRPQAVLVMREMGDEIILHVAPVDGGDISGVPEMMGGAYVATSDSRWTRLLEAALGHGFYGALPLHDRREL